MVRKRREGNFAYYSISDPVIFELCGLVCRKLSAQFDRRGRLGSHQGRSPEYSGRRKSGADHSFDWRL